MPSKMIYFRFDIIIWTRNAQHERCRDEHTVLALARVPTQHCDTLWALFPSGVIGQRRVVLKIQADQYLADVLGGEEQVDGRRDWRCVLLAFRTSTKSFRRTRACSDESTGTLRPTAVCALPPSDTWPAAPAAVRASSIRPVWWTCREWTCPKRTGPAWTCPKAACSRRTGPAWTFWKRARPTSNSTARRLCARHLIGSNKRRCIDRSIDHFFFYYHYIHVYNKYEPGSSISQTR